MRAERPISRAMSSRVSAFFTASRYGWIGLASSFSRWPRRGTCDRSPRPSPRPSRSSDSCPPPSARESRARAPRRGRAASANAPQLVLVRRDLRRRGPLAVDVPEEVIARLDRTIHPVQVDAPGAVALGGSRRGGGGGGRLFRGQCRHRKQCDQGNRDSMFQFHRICSSRVPSGDIAGNSSGSRETVLSQNSSKGDPLQRDDAEQGDQCQQRPRTRGWDGDGRGCFFDREDRRIRVAGERGIISHYRRDVSNTEPNRKETRSGGP